MNLMALCSQRNTLRDGHVFIFQLEDPNDMLPDYVGNFTVFSSDPEAFNVGAHYPMTLGDVNAESK